MRPVIPAALRNQVASDVILFGEYESSALSGKWRQQQSDCANTSCPGFVQSRPTYDTPTDGVVRAVWPPLNASELQQQGASVTGRVTFQSRQPYPDIQAYVNVECEVYCQTPQPTQGTNMYMVEITLLPATRPTTDTRDPHQVFVLDEGSDVMKLTLLINGVAQPLQEIQIQK